MKTPIELLRDKGWGPARLAKSLGGISSQAISQWKQVPADKCVPVAELTGMAPHELRPDVFPAPKPSKESA